MNITNSPDITVLEISPTFDLSGTLPVISVVNMSQGPNLAGLTTWFVVKSPTGTLIHEGSFDSPDIVGAWTNFTINDNWPRPFNQLEWSGAPYNITVYVQDSIGNNYNNPNYNATICRPNGNTPTSKTFYGVSSTSVRVKCDQARIYFEDQTNHSYRGIDGIQIASVLRMVYPIDETGNIPTPFVLNNFTIALVPISYSSDNYQFQSYSIYDYDLGGFVHVRIRYQSLSKNQASYISFPVLCNIDLGVLACEFAKLVDSLENGSCSDVQETTRKLSLISPKMTLVGLGIDQPLTGIDVPSLIQQIQTIGGFSCDCCNAPTGIIPNRASIVDGFTFDIVPVCGDITGTVTVTGTNIQFNLSDKSYVFALSSAIPTTAFTVTPSVNGCVKTYTFNVNLTILSTDILDTIKSDAGLVNLFNSIVAQGGEIDLTVDGGCIFQSTSTFNYTFTTLGNIPVNTTYALLSGIMKSAVVQPLFTQFNLTNLPALQSYLNSLGIGTFVVTNPSGQIVQIVSNANPNILSSLTYKVSSTTYIATQSSTASGYVAISANQVVQYIINYLCGITDAKVVTSQDYTICYIDPVSKQKVIVSVPASTTLANFFSTLTTNECKTIDYITSLGTLTCASVQAIFPQSPNVMTGTDYLLGTKGGACARLFPVEFGIAMLGLGSFDQTFVDSFCALVTQCAGGKSCAPYTLFQVLVVPFDSSCPNISGFNYSFTDTTFNLNQVIFGNTPSGSQTVTLEYRVHNTGSYTLVSSSINVAPDGTPSAIPTIAMASGVSYDIRLSNNCSSPVSYFVNTVTAPGSTFGTVDLFNNLAVSTVNTVTGISGFTLSFPIGEGEERTGTHDAFSGVIGFNITVLDPGNALLVVNGSPVECVEVPSSGTYAFATQVYNINDSINITWSAGGCL